MNKTRIASFDSTWNPLSGCYHGCNFCYAKGISNRFKGMDEGEEEKTTIVDGIHILDNPISFDGRKSAYPFGFEPTFYRYRLNEYEKKKGRMIFVCSMADLFGSWIPDWLIKEVFDACLKAPQHSYMFLTKNPSRYMELYSKELLPNEKCMYYGFSLTKGENNPEYLKTGVNSFVSIEPLLGEVEIPSVNWVIIGAETGNRKDKIIPEKRWIDKAVCECEERKIPIFMKPTLVDFVESIKENFPNDVIRKE